MQNDNTLDEWIPLANYAPEFLDTELDFPDQEVDQKFFASYVSEMQQQGFLEDIMLANKISNSGLHNRFGCHIPIRSVWNIHLLDILLFEYKDRELIEWLTFGFPVSRVVLAPDPTPASCNHLGATLYPEVIDEYVNNEVRLGALIGPFTVPPFISRIGISPLSSRPKKDTGKRRVILDLSYPFGELLWYASQTYISNH